MLKALLCTVALSVPWDHRPQEGEVKASLQGPHAFARKADRALDHLVGTSLDKLDENGHSIIAAHYRLAWTSHLGELEASEESLGEHMELSEFLTDLYDTLASTFGVTLCHAMHFDDLVVFNYGIPVTFHFSGVTEAIDLPEYRDHFEPLAGALAYWTTDLACMTATEGTLAWLCMPAAMLARYAIEENVAPLYSPKIWARFYPQDG